MKCCDCKEEKEPIEFYKSQKRCKDCNKLRNQAFKDKNPNYFKKGGYGYSYGKIGNINKYNKMRYAKYKDKYMSYNREKRQTPRGSIYSILEAIRGRAKKQGYSIDFDLEYLMELYETQNHKCAVTGIDFNFSDKNRIKRFRPFSASIDRIDNNGKYEKSNIRLVCVAFNLALNAFGEDIFRKMSEGYLKKQGYWPLP